MTTLNLEFLDASFNGLRNQKSNGGRILFNYRKPRPSIACHQIRQRVLFPLFMEREKTTLQDRHIRLIAPGEFSIWVFDSKGVPVFTTDLVATLTPYLKPQEISRVLKTGGEWVTIERGNAADLSGYLLPLPDQNWAVGIFRKVPDKETEHGVLVWTNILFFLLVCLLTLIVGSTVNQVLVSKFKKLMNSVFD